MAARSAAGAPLSAFWFLRRLHFRHDRRRRPVRPVVEAIESRLLLAGTSPTNPVPIRTKPTGTPTPQQLGAAYRQVVAIQTTTLQSLSDSHREVAAAAAQFAGRTAVTIDELSAELSHANNPHQAAAIATAIRRDRQILNLGEAAAARAEQGLDVARGIAIQQATTDKIYIPNGLYTTLTELVQQDRSTGAAISRSGRRSANALVRKLNELESHASQTIPPSA